MEWDFPDLIYRVWQIERCPNTGRNHAQGYFYFPTLKSLNGARRGLPEGAHLERARGTPEQNREYCTKADTRVLAGDEVGEVPRAGRRTDLEDLAEVVREHGAAGVVDRMPDMLIRYPRGIDRLERELLAARNKPVPEVFILWGDPGAGKSRRVRELAPDVWSVPSSGEDFEWKWFDGYKGQEDVVFDDFEPRYQYLAPMLRWIDRYRIDVPVKGGFVNWVPRRIFLTSNTDPELWFRGASPSRVAAFFRRVTEITEVILGGG